MRLEDKLAILADAAKYDVSCASSGSRRKNFGKRLGNTAASGICHTYTEDGRCVSLLKILLTNHCIYDCVYCVNRRSNDIPRAAFTAREVVSLTIDFYRRNYIEGLFLSSGVVRSPDDTMERMVRVVKRLREEGFHGYIHLKCVPDAGGRLIRQAGRHADRLSINIELPSEKSLVRLTRDKSYPSVLTPMGIIQEKIAQNRADRKHLRHVPSFAPAGQSTQLIIGASPESDYEILALADRLYRGKSLKRIYYSAYIPVLQPGPGLPDITEPPLRRENRLYQSDWLMRLYGFSLEEVITPNAPFLDLNMDPKQAYALNHPDQFPVDINRADREMILRVPGIGIKSANRIVGLRRHGRIRYEHLKQLGVVVSRATVYLRCDGMPNRQWIHAVPGTGGPEPARSAGSRKETDRENPSELLVMAYDGSFDGLLTVVFKTYEDKMLPQSIERSGAHQMGLFDRRRDVASDPNIAERVWKGLGERLGWKQRRKLYDAFLSGDPGVEMAICRYIRDIVPAGDGGDAHLTSHILINSLAQRVRREAHRMKGFIRFQRMGDSHYLAMISPSYDVLPLIRRHFEARFADQDWTIYDTRRNYGLNYDGHTTRELQLNPNQLEFPPGGAKEYELHYQRLWRKYYQAVNIDPRNNPKLHARQLPRRYWRYLPEKQNATR
jgi:probable DNA metabolism protein